MINGSRRKKFIKPYIQFIDFKGRECLCDNGIFANFVDSRFMLYELKYKRNNLLQLDAFIEVDVTFTLIVIQQNMSLLP